jgi:DNA-binding NtrC family response regulator
MPRDTISDVVVMHAHGPMRALLRMALAEDGYLISEAPTYTAVLRHLRAASRPIVVVAGNWAPDYRSEIEFFHHIAADTTLARRHRCVLLCTVPEWLPVALDSTLHALGVAVLRMPTHLPELLDTVAMAAGRTQTEDESAG